MVQTRRHATECPGTALSSHHGLMNLRLGNKGNHCYGNSALRGFIAAAVAHGGLSTMFNGGMLGFIEGLLRSKGIVFLWAQPFWVALTRDWVLPSRQHDGAEFILFLLNKLPFTADSATATWQARQRDGDTYRVTDWGRSAPLLLHPPAWQVLVIARDCLSRNCFNVGKTRMHCMLSACHQGS